MASYFMSRASNGDYIQIDDNYVNYAFVQKFGVQPTANTDTSASAGTGQWSFNVQGLDPIVVVVGDGVGMDMRQQSGSTFTFTGKSNTTAQFAVYIFDKPVLAGSGQYLQIRNAANEIVFDATARYMRIMGNLGPGASNSIPIPAGKLYGYMLALSGQNIFVGGGIVGGGPYWLVQVINTRPSGVVTTNAVTYVAFRTHFWTQDGQAGNPVPQPGGYGINNALIPVVDVTGY